MLFISTNKIQQELKANLKLSLPLIASQVLYSATGFIATLMIAHLGKVDLAASVLISMLWWALSVVFFRALNAVSVLVAHQYGNKNYAEIGKITAQAFIMSALLIILICASLQAIPFIMRHSGEPSNLYGLAMQYLHSIIWWVPALTLMIMLEQIMFGIGKTRLVMIVSIILVPAQVLFTYCLMFGRLHMPATGIAGPGYGIATIDTLGVIFLLLYLIFNKEFAKYELFKHFHLRSKYLWELIRTGTPMGIMSFVEISTFALMTYVIGHFGTTQLAAHQITIQYGGLFITLVFAMSQAITVRVGHAVGELNKEALKYAIGVGMLLNFAIMVLLCSLLLFAPIWLAHFDLNVRAAANQAVIQNVIKLFKVNAFLLLFDNFRIIGFGALRGIKDNKFPMLASIIAFWVIGASCIFLFAFVFHGEDVGAWLGTGLGIMSGALLILGRIIYKVRRINLTEILAVR